MKKLFITFFGVILLINQSFTLETYKLSNGVTIEGEIESENNNTLSIKTDYDKAIIIQS